MANAKVENKVLYICWGRKGGIPRFALEFAQNPEVWQDKNAYFSLSKNSDLFQETLPYAQQGFHISTYDSQLEFVLAILKLPILYFQLGKFIKQNKIKMAFTFSSHYLLPFFMPLFRLLNVKFVLLLHDPEFHLGEENSIRNMLQMILVRNADHILTLSNYASLIAQKNLKVPAHRITSLFHPPFYLNDAKSIDNKPLKIEKLLFIGRLQQYKNMAALLKIFEILKQKYPHVTLTIAGEGQIDQALLDQIKEAGISLIKRWIPDSEFPEILSQHDLLILPYSEATQSGAIAAAYGCNRPVVTTPVGGLIEQVEQGKTGMIAQSTEPEDMAKAVEFYLEDPKVYQGAIKEIAKHNAEYGWAVFIRNLWRVINLVK